MVSTIVESLVDDAPLSASKQQGKKDKDKVSQSTGDVLVGRTVTINRPRNDLFAFWRDFRNLPSFMENVERVDCIDETRSHWVVKAPAGKYVEWDALITEERPGEMIAWTSADNADVPHSGRIEFRDAAERGTTVTATIQYDPPAGIVGRLVAKFFQREPAIQARRDLRRFKQLMETGEVSTAARTRAEALKEKE